MAPRALVTHYARCLAHQLRGHPLYDPEPHDPHHAFLVEGTRLFDVAWIDSSGNLRYAFSTGLGPNDARNQDNTHVSLLPPGHERYTGCRRDIDFRDIMADGQPYYSETVDVAQVEGSISVPVAPGVAPSSVSAALGFSISEKAAALLYVPDAHTFWVDDRINLSSNYARKHTAAWYRFLNGDNGHRAVRNGELYFITGCQKTKEWHNLCAYSSSSARSISVQFHPIPEANVGFSGRFICSSSGIHPQRGPVQGAPAKETQCGSVVGWKLALCNRFLRFAKVPVETDKAAESPLSSKLLGQSRWAPYSSKQTSISSSEPPASGNHNSPTGGLQAANTKETLSNTLGGGDPQIKFEDDKIIARTGDTCWIDTGKQLGIDGEPPSTHALTEVFPYIEESAPWMDVVIAHDSHYLSLLGKGEYVPDAQKLAARLMRNFVIDVDEDMNGMLVNREEENLTKDDLAFVVHDARRYTDNALGFDVIRKNIPAGWTLAPARFGLGVQSPAPSEPVSAVADSHSPGAALESSQPDKSSFSMIDEQEDEEDDGSLLPPPPYTKLFKESSYADMKAGLASLECLNDFKGAKPILAAPEWFKELEAYAPPVQEVDVTEGMTSSSKLQPNKFVTLLASARQQFILGEPVPEELEAMALSAVKKLFAVLENSGRPRLVKFVQKRKRVLEAIGYSM